MGCAVILEPDGTKTFVCGSGVKPCSCCASPAGFLCDYPMGRGKTCDAELCKKHAIPQGPRSQRLMIFAEDPEGDDMLHFCPAHEAITRKRRSLPT